MHCRGLYLIVGIVFCACVLETEPNRQIAQYVRSFQNILLHSWPQKRQRKYTLVAQIKFGHCNAIKSHFLYVKYPFIVSFFKGRFFYFFGSGAKKFNKIVFLKHAEPKPFNANWNDMMAERKRNIFLRVPTFRCGCSAKGACKGNYAPTSMNTFIFIWFESLKCCGEIECNLGYMLGTNTTCSPNHIYIKHYLYQTAFGIKRPCF